MIRSLVRWLAFDVFPTPTPIFVSLASDPPRLSSLRARTHHQPYFYHRAPAPPGTKVGYYFAWLKFYTAALVFPTVIGLWVWWTERVNAENEKSGICVPGMYVCIVCVCALGSAVRCGAATAVGAVCMYFVCM